MKSLLGAVVVLMPSIGLCMTATVDRVSMDLVTTQDGFPKLKGDCSYHLSQPPERISNPLVRFFCLTESATGTRISYMLIPFDRDRDAPLPRHSVPNSYDYIIEHSHSQPTVAGKLFQTRQQTKVASYASHDDKRILAYRVEIWSDGILLGTADKSKSGASRKAVPSDWYVSHKYPEIVYGIAVDE